MNIDRLMQQFNGSATIPPLISGSQHLVAILISLFRLMARGCMKESRLSALPYHGC